MLEVLAVEHRQALSSSHVAMYFQLLPPIAFLMHGQINMISPPERKSLRALITQSLLCFGTICITPGES